MNDIGIDIIRLVEWKFCTFNVNIMVIKLNIYFSAVGVAMAEEAMATIEGVDKII